MTREVGITVALKFENCNINATVGKKNEFMSDFFFVTCLKITVGIYHSGPVV
jgi:hypothetical protein